MADPGKTPSASEITPEAVARDRRAFLKSSLLFTATAAGVGGGLLWLTHAARRTTRPMESLLLEAARGPYDTAEARTPYADVTSYNNFYEFGTSKEDPARESRALARAPVDGVDRRRGRIARWSSTPTISCAATRSRSGSIACAASRPGPWSFRGLGFPLAALLGDVEPTSNARSTSPSRRCCDPAQMPGQRSPVLDWPYVEGLRLDEAMHPADASRRRPLRPGAAEPERRAGPPRRSVEVRLQGHQVDREDRADSGPAADDLERGGPGRVRLLRQRESRRRPPALEPGDRAAHRRGRAPADASLQRLRRAGRRASTPAWTCGRTSEWPPAGPGSSPPSSPARSSRSRPFSGTPRTGTSGPTRSPRP